jgi:hypothetical protein
MVVAQLGGFVHVTPRDGHGDGYYIESSTGLIGIDDDEKQVTTWYAAKGGRMVEVKATPYGALDEDAEKYAASSGVETDAFDELEAKGAA